VCNGHENGIVVGVVVDLDDRKKLGRVKVRYPHLGNQRSNWARVAAPMAGPQRGAFFMPDEKDEVLVAFEQGDIRRPYVLGGLWSTADPPPVRDKPTENNVRQIRSRSGHVITFDDTKKAERIVIEDQARERRIVIDSAQKRIEVRADDGQVDVTAPKGKITLDAKSIVIKADTISIEGGSKVSVSATRVDVN
jgi:uncharacterized protein involved in type VI secretion and phage assembly